MQPRATGPAFLTMAHPQMDPRMMAGMMGENPAGFMYPFPLGTMREAQLLGFEDDPRDDNGGDQEIECVPLFGVLLLGLAARCGP